MQPSDTEEQVRTEEIEKPVMVSQASLPSVHYTRTLAHTHTSTVTHTRGHGDAHTECNQRLHAKVFTSALKGEKMYWLSDWRRVLVGGGGEG